MRALEVREGKSEVVTWLGSSRGCIKKQVSLQNSHHCLFSWRATFSALVWGGEQEWSLTILWDGSCLLQRGTTQGLSLLLQEWNTPTGPQCNFSSSIYSLFGRRRNSKKQAEANLKGKRSGRRWRSVKNGVAFIYLPADKRTLAPCEIRQSKSLSTQVPSDANTQILSFTLHTYSPKLGQKEAVMTQMQGSLDNSCITIHTSRTW